jgi:hypothetical protein
MFACCDESGIQKGSRWWVIGAMWLPDDRQLPGYEASVTRLRQSSGCWGEFKWTKVDPSWLDAYRELLQLTLSLPNLKFTGLVVDTSLFTRAAMTKYHAEGGRDAAYLKFVRMLLRNHIERFAARGHREFTVLYDKMSPRRELIREFRSVLESDIQKVADPLRDPCRFKQLSSVNSASRPLMQATDLYAGAIGSVWNGTRDDSKKGEARRALREQLTAWAGCDLKTTSNPLPRHDLWEWKPRGA